MLSKPGCFLADVSLPKLGNIISGARREWGLPSVYIRIDCPLDVGVGSLGESLVGLFTLSLFEGSLSRGVAYLLTVGVRAASGQCSGKENPPQIQRKGSFTRKELMAAKVRQGRKQNVHEETN